MTDQDSAGPLLRNPLMETLRAGKLGIIVHIGSTDLSDAMGIPGKFSSSPEVMQKMVRLGVRFVTAGSEWDFMLSAARQRAGVLRQLPLGN